MVKLWNIYFFRLLKQSTEAAHEDFKKGTLTDQPFMDSLFSNTSLSWDDVIMLVMEIFLGGIDAVSKIKGFAGIIFLNPWALRVIILLIQY